MKRICSFVLTAVLAFLPAVCSAQKEEVYRDVLDNVIHAGGSSMSYQYEPQAYTPPPKGYKPFYISHIGRHGSRFHNSKDIFPKLTARFASAEKAGVLTALGKDVMERVNYVASCCEGRIGDLSSVGVQEHKSIAGRMYDRYPAVFKGRDKKVYARSTTSARCILSMAAFCEALKERNARLDITRQAGDTTNHTINHATPEYRQYFNEGPWKPLYNSFLEEHFDASEVIGRLFTDASLFDGDPNGKSARSFVMSLFSLAAIMPASGLGVDFYDIFTEKEILPLWEAQNMSQYMRKGPSPISGGLAISIMAPLLQDFVTCADEVIARGGRCADLRFGHGEDIMPVTGLMGIDWASREEADPEKMCLAWQDYKVTSMGSNVQWIFYRNRKGNVLVKILLNEKESSIPVATNDWPYYPWEDVRAYYNGVLASIRLAGRQ